MIWLVLVLAGFGSFAAAQPSTLQAGTVEVVLELSPDEGLLVNRLNPPEVSLESPWKASPLAATVSGEPWAEQPDIYFSRVDPVRWTLNVPAGTAPGRYEAAVSAKLGLCKKDDGFCFVREATRTVILAVSDTDQTNLSEAPDAPDTTVTLKFYAPSF